MRDATTPRATPGPAALCGALAGLAVLAAAAPSQAALVLQPPTLKTQVYLGFDPAATVKISNGPGTLSDGESAYDATVATSVQVGPSVLLQSSLTSFSGANVASGGFGQSNLTYHFGVQGPADIVVPVHLLADLSAQTSIAGASVFGPAAAGQAGLGIQGLGVNKGWSISTGMGSPVPLPASQDLAISDLLMVTANTVVTVNESTYASGRYTGAATASADPYFFIDPDFLADHPGFQLVFSAGVGNAPPGGGLVPEPAAWASLLTGFALLGARLRRRPRGAGRSRRHHRLQFIAT